MPDAATPPDAKSTVSVDRLTLQLSGLSETDGRRLALLITDGLAAASLRDKTSYEINAMRIRADAQPGQSVDQLSKSIVDELVRQIMRT